MAAARAKAANIGSAQWIQKEREQGEEFVEQELEEFGYSVRNEMEWLNEHMAEIFSTNAMYVVSRTRLAYIFANSSQKLRRRVQNTRKTTRKDSSYCTQARCSGAAPAADRRFRAQRPSWTNPCEDHHFLRKSHAIPDR